MIDFSNFHDQTRATFAVCDRPNREPDFISDSGSVYWDTGLGVIRLSDHWAGQHGCVGQRSCIWSLDQTVEPATTAAGHCHYRDFEIRPTIPVWHQIKKADTELAGLLAAHGGAIPASFWVTGTGRRTTKKVIPVWAREETRDYVRTPAAKKLLTTTHTRIAITAETTVIRKITKGAGKIKIGSTIL